MNEAIKKYQDEYLEKTKLPSKILASDLLKERKIDKLRIAELEVRLKYFQNELDDIVSLKNSLSKLNYSLKKEMYELTKYNNILIDIINKQILENNEQTNEINDLLLAINNINNNFVYRVNKIIHLDNNKTI
jgi:hypothetical protein